MRVSFRNIIKFHGNPNEFPKDHLLEFGDLLENVGINVTFFKCILMEKNKMYLTLGGDIHIRYWASYWYWIRKLPSMVTLDAFKYQHEYILKFRS